MAADNIYKILNDEELKKQNGQYHQNIVEEAKNYGIYLKKQQQQQ